jgi:hypothetical protein
MFHQPVGDCYDPDGKQPDVETKLASQGIALLLSRGEQVDEDRGQSGTLQFLGYELVPGTVTAAAAAVCEEHQSVCRLRDSDIGLQRYAGGGDLRHLLDGVHGSSIARGTVFG